MNEPKAMREIHKIREKIYEQRKGMTPTEYNAEVGKNTEALLEKSGYKLVPVEGKPGISRMVRA